MSRPALLIVDDEFATRETLVEFLGRKFDVAGAGNGSDAIKLLQERDFDLVLTDLRMPEADGMSVLEAAKSNSVIISTGGGAILKEENVRALKQNGRIYFLNRHPDDIIPTKDRPLSSSREALLKRYEERFPTYMKTCDVSIDVKCDQNTLANMIKKDFQK